MFSCISLPCIILCTLCSSSPSSSLFPLSSPSLLYSALLSLSSPLLSFPFLSLLSIAPAFPPSKSQLPSSSVCRPSLTGSCKQRWQWSCPCTHKPTHTEWSASRFHLDPFFIYSSSTTCSYRSTSDSNPFKLVAFLFNHLI